MGSAARRRKAPLHREIDQARGAFDPYPRQPEVQAEPGKSGYNPRGTRHRFKTEQDRLPVERRQRVREWRERLKKM